MSGLEERPDLLDLPMFGSDPDRGARRPGRVRGGFRFPEEPAEPPVAEKPRVVPIRPQQATPALPVAGVDWAEVTRFRSDVAKLLPARVGGVSDRSAEEAAGWSVIRQLLDEEAASSIAKTGDMRSVADQEAARCLVTVVKLVGWISWAVLTTSIAIDILSRLRHVPVPQLRGFALPQLLARGLITAVLAGFLAVNNVNDLATGAAAAPPAPTTGPPAATAPLHAPDRKPAPATHRYTVKRGDTLSEIALDELGDGHVYPRIYQASKHTVQPDGRKLTDPDLIIPG